METNTTFRGIDEMSNIIKEDNIERTLQDNIVSKPIEFHNGLKNNIANDIMRANETGFINSLVNSNLALRPSLLVNDFEKGNKVLSEIISELRCCEEFILSVAFVTSSGVVPLLETLRSLEQKGVRGKILTTDYLNFSEPKALKRLLGFSNISVRLYTKDSFHTKGYIFRHSDHYKLIVGSSNLTQTALTKNKEWNIKVSSLDEGALTEGVLKEFEHMWQEAEELTISWIDAYENIYKKQREYTRQSKVPRLSQHILRPNKMQVAAIESLNRLRANDVEKALLISATGTGKTYLSAFDLRNFNPKRALFIVHREQIARKSLESFRNVFGDTRTMGILSGNYKEVKEDFIFATIQTLTKEDVYSSFAENEFDYIIIDEVHKAGATSYDRILRYFKPKFLLGMTATPERGDGFDIFKLFDHNIAYEIRLQQALEEDLLCPFHYFGISDISINGETLNDNTDFKYLVDDDRVNHIISKINFYGHDGDRVKGLVFCSDRKEASELSRKFNNKGFRTICLTGDNNQKEREDAIERLEQDEQVNCLDYIFTVDIFNEGIDIPAINQVIMLRPTKSAIIFIQQLGRGLRKNKNKEYVVVLDFVGNYDSNFLIPIALSGDRSYNKDNIRKYVMEGSRVIPGCSTINFDEISKKKIFESIDKVNFNDIKLIKESYTSLKQKLGRIPKLNDFELYGAIEPMRIFDNGSLGSYYKFLRKYEKEYDIELNSIQESFIEFISKKLANGKRIHELEMIKIIVEDENKSDYREYDLIGILQQNLKDKYDIHFKDTTQTSIINVLTNEFPAGTGKKTYKQCIFLEKYGENYGVSKVFRENLEDCNFKDIVNELVEYGIQRYNKLYRNSYLNTSLKLYEKYTYEDVCRLLEWEHAEVALNIGGYKFDRISKTYPVFINYEKSEDINDSINYEDRFLSSNQLIAISKSGRSPESEDVVQAYKAEENGVQMHLFVRKNKDDKISKEFYYLGKIRAIGTPKPIVMKNTNKKAVEIGYNLYTPVREDIYDYIIS